MERKSELGQAFAALLQRIEAASPPDQIKQVHDRLGAALDEHAGLADILTGKAVLGVPLHPALVHFPIGATFAAAVLDVCLGRQADRATTVVQGFALASVMPTAVAGLADFLQSRHDPRINALGSAHAAAASIASTMSLASFSCRLRGRSGQARGLLLAACLGYLAAGAFGGELVYRRQASRRRA